MSGKIGDNLFRASGVIAEASADFDDDQLQSNTAMLGFKVAVNGSLVRYNLVNQTIDEYFDTSGVDAATSVNDDRVASGSNYYYRGASSVTPTVTGPDSTTTDGTDTVYWITSTGATSFDNDITQDYEMLVIAGGGSGGRGYGGSGGGAGGLLHNVGGTKITLTGGTTYTCTVGTGGASITSGSSDGNDGVDTTITGSGLTTITATGGGGGEETGDAGHDGGSGGGGNYSSGFGGSGTQGDSGGLTGYGNDGGRASKSNNTDSGGGGGGANGAGGYPQTNSGIVYTGQESAQPNGGVGGAGLQVDIDGNNYYWAGGGGAGCGTIGASPTGGDGGIGGGGAAGQTNGMTAGTGGTSALNAGGDGTSPGGISGAGGANTGSGGGGTSHGNGVGSSGAGGTGVVALKAPTSSVSAGGDLTLQSTDVTATAQPDYAELVTLMENGDGTATLNTDIKGYVSRDSGTTFTQGTLADEGSWGTDKKILAFHDLDISGQPAGTSMCYKITTHNQSAGSKETYIWATSIGWR